MTKTKLSKFVDKALNEMFKCVGFDGFDKEFTNDPSWFTKKTWTLDTEEKFKDWFYKTAKQDLKWNKVTIQKEYSWFNLMYGWKIE